MNIFLAAITSDIRQELTALGNPWANTQDISVIVSRIITFALTIAAVVFAGMLIWGGIQWITSGGDKEQVSSAQKRITAAIVGTIVLFSTWAIIHTTRGFFGLESMGGGGGDGDGGGGGVNTDLNACQGTICKETACQSNLGWCYKGCRCICDSSGGKWAYENPWCDTDTHQYACSGTSRVSDAKGSASGVNKNCSGDK